MFSDQDEQQAREDYESKPERTMYCSAGACSNRVPFSPDEDVLCPDHERESDADAMDDMLWAAKMKPRMILGRVLGHLAASSISMEEYLVSGRIIEQCMFETHFREAK